MRLRDSVEKVKGIGIDEYVKLDDESFLRLVRAFKV